MRDFNLEGQIIGRPSQSIHEYSATQKYPIGTIYEAFGKRWRYCKASEAIVVARRGAPSMIYNPWLAGAVGFGSDGATVTGLAGFDYVVATLGADYDVGRGVDVLQDGILTLYPAAPRDNEIFQFRIVGNDPSYQHTLADDRIKIYIDPPLRENVTAWPADCLPSPYRYVGNPSSGTLNKSFIVVPEIIVPNANFFWGQTRGPAWVIPNAGWQNAGYRMCRFHSNGTILPALDSSGVAYQVAGYLLADNVDADDAHIFLMLE